jgi:hypothetical protein
MACNGHKAVCWSPFWLLRVITEGLCVLHWVQDGLKAYSPLAYQILNKTMEIELKYTNLNITQEY